MDIQNFLQEAIKRITDQFHPEKIILFGSYAYGQPTTDSDVDLLIIMDTDMKPYERSVPVRKQVGWAAPTKKYMADNTVGKAHPCICQRSKQQWP